MDSVTSIEEKCAVEVASTLVSVFYILVLRVSGDPKNYWGGARLNLTQYKVIIEIY